MNNPYEGRGKPVFGERLVGRDALLAKIHKNVSAQNNCSIIGLPRMGKTSIAQEVLQRIPSSEKIITAQISLDAASSPAQVFTRLMTELGAESIAPEIRSDHDLAYEEFIGFARKLTRAGKAGFIVIDEVDAVLRKSFAQANLFLSRLREIANRQSAYGQTFIFISRRSLNRIQDAVESSTLAGICKIEHVGPLHKDAITKLAQRVCLANKTITEDAISELWNLSGGHPFLAEILMYETVEMSESQISPQTLTRALESTAVDLITEYMKLVELLKEDDLFDPLCELTVGPWWRNVNGIAIPMLKQYGALTELNDGKYGTFSKHFEGYLENLSREIPTWPLLGEVERELRSLVSDRLSQKYGDPWLTNFVTKFPKLSARFAEMENKMTDEKRRFGPKASHFILDYSYIGDLKDILMIEWDLFRSIFNGSKSEWEKAFQDVIAVRNPLGHNRPSAIPQEVLHKAEQACKCIRNKLKCAGTN
jgi:hypothetical protein